MIEFNCPQCSEAMESPEAQAGLIKFCPKCGASVVVPGTPEEMGVAPVRAVLKGWFDRPAKAFSWLRRHARPIGIGLIGLWMLAVLWELHGVRASTASLDDSLSGGRVFRSRSYGLFEELDAIQRDLSSVQADVSDVQLDVSNMKRDVSSIESDVSSIKRDVSSIESDVSSMKISGVRTRE